MVFTGFNKLPVVVLPKKIHIGQYIWNSPIKKADGFLGLQRFFIMFRSAVQQVFVELKGIIHKNQWVTDMGMGFTIQFCFRGHITDDFMKTMEALTLQTIYDGGFARSRCPGNHNFLLAQVE